MFILPKSQDSRLTYGLTIKEFRCKCGYKHCRSLVISKKLLNAFYNLKNQLNIPLYILSGHRCSNHNYDVKGSPVSRHTIGEAVDIAAFNLLEKFKVDDIMKIAKKCGFTYIIYYDDKNFFHFDVRSKE